MDLICGGVPSRLLIEKFIENAPYEVKRILSFRSKEKGWTPRGFQYNLKIEDSSGIIHDYTGIRNLITTGFACEMTNRYSCYECKFAGARRMSDFTIGDYWGNTLYPEQNKKGVSVAITHTEKGKRALQSSELELHEIGWRDFLFRNPRTVYGKGVIPKSRKHLAKAFATDSYERLQEDYANKGSWRRPVSFLNRILLVLQGIRMTKKRQQKVEQILNENNL